MRESDQTPAEEGGGVERERDRKKDTNAQTRDQSAQDEMIRNVCTTSEEPNKSSVCV